MAYYNPTGKDTDYNFEEPREHGGIVRAVLGALGTMAVGIAAYKVSGAAGNYVSRKIVQSLSRSSHEGLRTTARRATDYAGARGRRTGATVSDLLKSHPKVRPSIDAYNKAMGRSRAAYKRALKPVEDANNPLLARFKQKMGFFAAKGDRKLRMIGAAEKWARTTLSSAVPFYISDRFIGVMPGHQGADRPALYNVPGVALDIIKTTASFAPYDIAFKGVGLAASAIGAGLEQSGASLLRTSGKGITNFVATTQHALTTGKYISKQEAGLTPTATAIANATGRLMRQTKAYGKGAVEVVRSLNKEFTIEGTSLLLGTPARRIHWKRVKDDKFFSNLIGTVKQAWDASKVNYSHSAKMTDSRELMQGTIIPLINDLRNKRLNPYRGAGRIDLDPIINAHQKVLSARTPKPGFFGRMIGAEQAKVNNIKRSVQERKAAKDVFDNLGELVGRDQAGKLRRTWENMTVGKGLYRAKNGMMADFDVFNPVTMLKRAVHFASNITMNFPLLGFNVNPLAILKADTHFAGRGAKFRYINLDKGTGISAEDYRIKIKTSTGKVQAGRLSDLADTQSKSAFFIDGKFWMHSESGWAPAHSQYWLRPEAQYGKYHMIQAREGMTSHAGKRSTFAEYARQAEKLGKGRIGKYIYALSRKFEFGVEYGGRPSIWSKLRAGADRIVFGKSHEIDRSMDVLFKGDLKKKISSGAASLEESGYSLRLLNGMFEDIRKETYTGLSDPQVIKRLASRISLLISPHSSSMGGLRGVGSTHTTLDRIWHNEKDLVSAAENMLNSSKEMTAHARRAINDIVINSRAKGMSEMHKITSLPGRSGQKMRAVDDLRYYLYESGINQHMKAYPDKNIMKELLPDIDKLSLTANQKTLLKGFDTTLSVQDKLSNLRARYGGDSDVWMNQSFITDVTRHLKRTRMKEINGLVNYYKREPMKLHIGVTDGIPRTDISMGSAPFVSFEKSPAMAGQVYTYLTDRLADMGQFFGFSFDPLKYSGSAGMTRYMMKRAGQVGGALLGLKAMDTFFDVNPLFNQTMLDEGLYVAGAEQAVKARMLGARIADGMGITHAARYFEGLMPSVTTTIPGGIAGWAIGGPVGAVGGAIINRALSPFLPNITKSYDELKEIYSGREEVAIRRGRWWELGRTPYEGVNVERFRPNWYARLKSQYMYTPNALGGKLEAFLHAPWPFLDFNPIGAMLDPYHYERKHYSSRPYPATAVPFKEIPFLGPTLAATVGRLVKPMKFMHGSEIAVGYNQSTGDKYLPSIQFPTGEPVSNYVSDMTNIRRTGGAQLRGRFPSPMNPYEINRAIGEQVYRFTEAVGFPGFVTETLLGGGLKEDVPLMATAGDIASMGRAYWGLDIGGGVGMTEFFRRFVPRERTEIDKWNPLRNMMPTWLPGGAENEYFIDFHTADPYTKVKEGELRLPGESYSALHDVEFSYPGRASSLGNDPHEMAAIYAGVIPPVSSEMAEILETGTMMHRVVQDNLAKSNYLIKAEMPVYNAKHDISGHIDAVIKDGSMPGGRRAIEIKTISGKGYANLTMPKKKHVSQLNFYLHELHGKMGTILYINRDDPAQIKTFDIAYSYNRFQRDLHNLEMARSMAHQMRTEGIGKESGRGYSRLDRLRILGDVAPYSNNYKETLSQVRAQRSAGMLDQRQQNELDKIQRHRKVMMRKYDFYPYRFAGKVMSPESTYNLQSENEFIKAAAEYSLPERIVGSIWERFIHLNTPFHSKLWHFRSPIEHYERSKLYMREQSFWNHPYRDFIEPYTRSLIAKQTMADGALGFGMAGAMFGGPVGGAAGAIFGGAYGFINGSGRGTHIPSIIREQRDLTEYFDRLKYEKHRRLYEQTGNADHRRLMGETMTGLNPFSLSREGWTSVYRAMPRMERPYFDAFLKTGNQDERDRMAEILPKQVADVLKVKWAQSDKSSANVNYDFGSSNRMTSYFKDHHLPGERWVGWHEGINLEDIQMVTVKNEGFDAHDWGLGWYQQEREVRANPFLPGPLDPQSDPEGEISTIRIGHNYMKIGIENAMRRLGDPTPLVALDSIPSDGSTTVNIQITVNRKRTKDIERLIRGY